VKQPVAFLSFLALAFLGCSQPAAPTRSSPRLLSEAEQAMLQGSGSARPASTSLPVGESRRSAAGGTPSAAGEMRLAAGRPEPAIRAFDQALTEQPPASVRWEIVFRRAVALRLQGDAARAVEGFRSVAAAPSGERGRTVTNDELHYEYATALFRLGDFKTARPS